VADSTSNSVTPGPFSGAAQDEGQLHLDTRRDEAVERDVAALREEHVVHQRRVVGLVDLAGHLHRARGQADLAALDGAAVGQFQRHPGALDGVAVVDGHARVLARELAQRRARLARVVQLAGQLLDGGGVEHGSSEVRAS
jgi:hypothetical protein